MAAATTAYCKWRASRHAPRERVARGSSAHQRCAYTRIKKWESAKANGSKGWRRSNRGVKWRNEIGGVGKMREGGKIENQNQ